MDSALLAGVSGLRAHQEMLDVVGNNLANSNTTGFKSQRLRFSDLVYQTLSQATNSSTNDGPVRRWLERVLRSTPSGRHAGRYGTKVLLPTGDGTAILAQLGTELSTCIMQGPGGKIVIDRVQRCHFRDGEALSASERGRVIYRLYDGGDAGVLQVEIVETSGLRCGADLAR